jgi:mRNA interferase MazF
VAVLRRPRAGQAEAEAPVTEAGLPSPVRGDVWWVSLDPTQGSEIRKTRPCLVLTANALNRHRQTVVVVPYSTGAEAHAPITVPVTCQGKGAVAVVDQVRAIAKRRLRSRLEAASPADLAAVGEALMRILEL